MHRNVKAAIVIVGASLIITKGVIDIRTIRAEEQAKRKAILNEMGLDVAAIHNATDVVNAKIEHGEITNYDELREAVLTEVAFQKIAIRENDEA